MLEGMGGQVTYVPLGELYTALLTGAVDAGTWGGYGADIGGKLHEVVDYVLVEPYIWAGNEHIIVSMDSWNALSERDQFLVQEAARAHAISAQNIWFTEDQRAREIILENKPTLTELRITDPAYLAARAASREQMLASWEASSPEAAEAVEIFKEYLELHGIE
jgi:TRAP-type C4-dicarboxylate transport system substrate-binding protein